MVYEWAPGQEDQSFRAQGNYFTGNYWDDIQTVQQPSSAPLTPNYFIAQEAVDTQFQPFEFRELEATGMNKGNDFQNLPWRFRGIQMDPLSLAFDAALLAIGGIIGYLVATH